MLHALLPLFAVPVLLSLAPAASAVEPRRLAWDELHQLVGERVSIPLYEGCAVSGKVIEIQPDSMLINVSKSSHPEACPPGPLRVPRATLYVLDLHKKGIRHRLAGTAFGFLSFAGCGSGHAHERRVIPIQIVR